jgi:hypothetical protein
MLRKAILLLPVFVTLGAFCFCKEGGKGSVNKKPAKKLPHDSSYDRYCHVPRNDPQWRIAKTKREAMLSQCAENPEMIFYSAYGVTNSQSARPILKTWGQRDCISLAIYNRRTKDALLAHLITDEEAKLPCFYKNLDEKTDRKLVREDKGRLTINDVKRLEGKEYKFNNPFRSPFCEREAFPRRWYAELFRNEYFLHSPPKDLEITIISTTHTPKNEIDGLARSILRHFSGTTIRHKAAQLSFLGKTNIFMDSRNGEIQFQGYSCAGKWCFPPSGKKVSVKESVIQ